MKKATILMVIVALLVTLGSGAALAKAFNGTNGPDDLTGTKKADKMDGRAGADVVEGRGGSDNIKDGSGPDEVSGGFGNDTINVDDGERDVVDCGGGGKDKIIFDDFDVAVPGTSEDTGNCELFGPEGEDGDTQE
jgi:Ca2+-binding RTX toxin-like protein